ncbi:hypothetical protein PV08_10169 [Exophiala spinifera]|uniref:DUF1750-domain-containing protein n=1 Tax=Exophiala spinifera TaxID=91928 RepID=A0A0D2AWL5_9EURO|nr:uncharacterized protein PV08_10169 [Exophiala spinifera]KIW10870.1 hypothetical protein PV08_10169 [Exophiala spinifera]
MNMLTDPAGGVPPQLLPHLHLLSKNRYPVASNPSLETIVGYLLEAPKVVREIQPVQWQMIETPQDGTLMLTWQPSEALGTTFASDGYIWADAEHRFTSEVRGYTLEIYVQRSGYRASGEAMASHSRKRYRLVAGPPNHGTVDPSLWLTHYSKASSRDHVPAASIPITPFVQAQIQQRRLIQSQGQLPRKEFMLHDRSNWPIIHLPPGMARAGVPGQARRAGSIGGEATLEEEEDVSRGDLLDFMTPRDISRYRYEQHHEWMEEILESPYPTLAIVPSDLGLGRKGALEELTKDFFDAPLSAAHEPSAGPPARVGRLPPGQVEEFTNRATKKLAEMQEELEKMKKRHARRMAKLQQSMALATAEKKLRTVPNVPERRSSTTSKADGSEETPRGAIEQIVHSVEEVTGMKVARASVVTVVSKGGLTELSKPAPSTAAQVTSPDKDAAQPGEMTDTPQAQQQGTAAKVETNNTSTLAQPQQNVSLPTAAAQTQPPAVQPEPEKGDGAKAEAAGHDVPMGDLGMDVPMGGLDGAEGTGNENQDNSEWVMVDQDDGGESGNVEIPETTNEAQLPRPDQTTTDSTTKPVDQPDTAPTQVPVQSAPNSGLNTPDFDMGGDFDNVEVDTAGDALASYDNDGDDLNLDSMEGSAFGDAFHPPEDEDMS